MLAALSIVGKLIGSGLGIFTTVSKEKRARRIEGLKVAFAAAKNEKRGVFGWALVFLAFAATVYDVATTGGENFDTMIQLVALAMGA